MGESETPGRLRGRPILWFALPMAVLVFVGASTPWIAQRVPRFLFPALAAAGAVLVVFLFVNSLVQFVRRHRGEGRLRFFAVAVNGVAAVFLVILPLTHLLRAMTPLGRWISANPRRLRRLGKRGRLPEAESASRHRLQRQDRGRRARSGRRP